MTREKEEKASALSATSWRFVLLGIGFGCLVGYVRMASLGFTGYLSQEVFVSIDAWYALRSAASLLVFAVLALSGLFRWFKVGTVSLLVATAAAVAAAIVFAVDESGSLGPVVAVLGGSATALLMYVWMLLLSRFDTKTIVGACLVGLVVAGAIVAGVPLLEASLDLVVAVAAAFMAGASALLLDADLSSCAPDGKLGKGEVALVPWPPVIMVLACGFASTVVYGIAAHLTWLYDWAPNNIAFGVSAVAAVAATFAIMLRRPDWMRLVWLPSLALLALALACSCFSVREAIQVAVGFMLASVLCAHFLYWAIFSAMFSTLKVPRAFLAGAFLFVASGSLAALAGDAIGAQLPHSMQNLGGVAGMIILVLAVILVAANTAYRRAFGSAGEPSASAERADAAEAAGAPEALVVPETGDAPEAPDAPAQEFPDMLKERMARYVQEYGLTPRESEVALLTMQGYSCSYIAEKLVVSNSTVRYHQQNIYRKFNVHSRNELIEFAAGPLSTLQ